METMKKGDKGEDVKKLQQALTETGFNPGEIDGSFGNGTLAALIAFQKSSALLADGIAGPRTLFALGLMSDATLKDVLSKFTFTKVKQMFPFTPASNIKTNLPYVLEGLRFFSLTDKPMALMALATIRAETESFKPINEMKSKWNTSPGGRPFDLYDNRKDLGNTGAPDGSLFKGRGFIQLTGRSNYKKYSGLLGLGDELIKNPELANDPVTAAKLLALFLKDKEFKIKEALLEKNYKAARKLVNGGSHGLENFTNAYKTGDKIII
jgi:putative chitinase